MEKMGSVSVMMRAAIGSVTVAAMSLVTSGQSSAQEQMIPPADPVVTVQDAIRLLQREPEPDRSERAAGLRGDIARWFGPEAYPAEAIRAGEQGRVVARLEIGRDGRVSSCTITASSGSASLDQATCAIATSKATFTPARDARGRPIVSTYTLPVRWVLPTGEAAPAVDASRAADFSSDLTIEYTIDAQGRLVACRVLSGVPAETMSADPCPAERLGQPFFPRWERNGRPVGARIVRREKQTITVEP